MNDLIQKMKDNKFYLGGSRRMAEKYGFSVNENTDFDFYCEDTLNNVSFLIENGFKKIEAENRNYWDDLLIDMCKHDIFPVEVLIRKDVYLYKKAFESISQDMFCSYIWKSSSLVNVQNKAQFREKICNFFNALFKLVK